MAKYYLLVNFFGTPKKRVGMSDAEMKSHADNILDQFFRRK